ncbi:MAG: hypothetical protein U9Q70_03250 [Chloroflexota bacterium]|nr:hypothetical protein [Chloroflexota bacterium]
MEQLAERARLSLNRFAGVEAEYNASGIQLLDEWIDRHTRQFPHPNRTLLTLWGAFLGQVFRQRYSGDWAVDKSTKKPQLGLLCPRAEHGVLFLDVMAQVERRIERGMQESLTFYYTLKGIELKEV